MLEVLDNVIRQVNQIRNRQETEEEQLSLFLDAMTAYTSEIKTSIKKTSIKI